ncbi:conserved hypothetical protein [Methanohalobium evestigatum Z-7303]|uniref:Uncharacterized protein n=1 Tax=Methanohalobium evestigatum (strain ATCC BAA-1072 / DSM 3721 / NBRC 107634 / OCM 161 / Z-7303) TaxID=644295 RepID=D7E909_METEZ|nr:hypothetical protein [Methanohalobium evestigatum]ADI73957.1 conserved hypothetical protein [Methanohalobium evestigatum Z-7303]
MESKYHIETGTLYINGYITPAYKFEKNEIGTCSTCNFEMVSISYHIYKNCYLVVTECVSCKKLYLNIFNNKWDWQNEIPLKMLNSKSLKQSEDVKSQKNNTNDIDGYNELEMLNNIPVKQMRTIFSPTEIEAMFAKARGEEYTRQYLYRARKKYQDFEDVFGIRLTI